MVSNGETHDTDPPHCHNNVGRAPLLKTNKKQVSLLLVHINPNNYGNNYQLDKNCCHIMNKSSNRMCFSKGLGFNNDDDVCMRMTTKDFTTDVWLWLGLPHPILMGNTMHFVVRCVILRKGIMFIAFS